MLLAKWKIGVVVLLALATTAAVFAQRRQPEKQPQAASAPAKAPAVPKIEANARPPLKKEWVGRWQADPFADTVAIDVHSSRTYRVKDPRKVAALMKKLTIRAFHNGLASDFPIIARLTFHKKDETSATVWIGEGPFFSGLGGEMYVDPAFLVALGREFPDAQGRPLDLLKRPQSPPQEKRVPLTLDSLKSGFESFSVTYYRGPRLRTAHITDRKALDELAKALVVVKQEREKAPKVQDWPPQTFDFIPKGQTGVNGRYSCLLDRQHVVIGDLGRLTVKPSFVKTLNAQLSRLEGRAVDVLGENPPPKEQLQREQTLRESLANARRVRFRRADGKEIVVQRREDVDQLLKGLAWVESPVRAWKLERAAGFIEFTTANEDKIRLIYLQTGPNNEKVNVAPGGDLVDVSGAGPMWLDSRFRDAVWLYAEQWEHKDDERRAEETFRLVCADLPAFFRQVYNLVVWYRQGKDESVASLTAEGSRPILEALKAAKIEKLSWTPKHWEEEMKKLRKRGAGTLILTPGLGFDLPVFFVGEKELLIPEYGRIRLQTPIIDKLRRALESDPEKAKTIEFLPR